jgi:hypothetical protein
LYIFGIIDCESKSEYLSICQMDKISISFQGVELLVFPTLNYNIPGKIFFYKRDKTLSIWKTISSLSVYLVIVNPLFLQSSLRCG